MKLFIIFSEKRKPYDLLFNRYRFQYILAAATSIATKNNEDTLTYLNQGQSYEIKLKKIGDLSLYRDKILKVNFSLELYISFLFICSYLFIFYFYFPIT